MSTLAIRSNRRQEAVSMTIIIGIQLMQENIKLSKKIANNVT